MSGCWESPSAQAFLCISTTDSTFENVQSGVEEDTTYILRMNHKQQKEGNVRGTTQPRAGKKTDIDLQNKETMKSLLLSYSTSQSPWACLCNETDAIGYLRGKRNSLKISGKVLNVGHCVWPRRKTVGRRRIMTRVRMVAC